MDWEVRGLPVHVLLIHAVVVLVPAAAASVVLASWWPWAQRKLGLLPPALALAAAVVTPITTQAGKWLRDRLPRTPLITAHADLGSQLLPWVLGLLVLSVVTVLVQRRPSSDRGATAVRVLVAVLATVVAVGATVQTARIGESGARAVWQGAVAGS